MADARRRHYYTPPAVVRDVPGLTRQQARGLIADEYSGDADAIVAAGLLPRELLPGQPGQPEASIALRPHGHCGPNARLVPGYMQVFRRFDGTFRVCLTVSEEEQQRRHADAEERARAIEAAAAGVLADIPPKLRAYVDTAIRAMGGPWCVEQRYSDPAWIAREQVPPRLARDVLAALELHHISQVERRLVRSGMDEARAFLDRIRAASPPPRYDGSDRRRA